MASFSTHKKQSSYIFYFHPRWKNEWKPNAWTDKLCEELSSFQSGLYNRIFLPKYFPLTATKKKWNFSYASVDIILGILLSLRLGIRSLPVVNQQGGGRGRRFHSFRNYYLYTSDGEWKTAFIRRQNVITWYDRLSAQTCLTKCLQEEEPCGMFWSKQIMLKSRNSWIFGMVVKFSLNVKN